MDFLKSWSTSWIKSQDDEGINEACSSGAKTFEWQLNFGGQWQKIENDHVLETHYRQPGAKAITINTTSGKLYINYDSFRTDNPSVRVQRLSFLSAGQTEDYGWFFRGDRRWTEFGSQSPNGSASISSRDLEQQFSANPAGRVSFNVGATGYSLDFSTMTQTNLSTSMRRKVRRRPRYPVPGSGHFAPFALVPPPRFAPPPAPTQLQAKWEFMGDKDWTEYQPHVCSYGSADIERVYQANRQGQLKFRAGRHSYTLDFAGMFQLNDAFGTKRQVRRTPHTSSPATPSLPRWQYQDVDGQWKDFVKGSGCCNLSSQEIELQYQQDPSGSLDFATKKFNYELDFAAMKQHNLSTNTWEPIRRLNH